jgi:hypothetical protein
MGVPEYVVSFKRRSLEIPQYRDPKGSRAAWTAAEIELLGKLPDDEVARVIQRSISAVLERRELLHIPKQNPILPRWTAAEEKLLGTRPDKAIAKLLNRPIGGVIHRRVRLRIPACSDAQ